MRQPTSTTLGVVWCQSPQGSLLRIRGNAIPGQLHCCISCVGHPHTQQQQRQQQQQQQRGGSSSSNNHNVTAASAYTVTRQLNWQSGEDVVCHVLVVGDVRIMNITDRPSKQQLCLTWPHQASGSQNASWRFLAGSYLHSINRSHERWLARQSVRLDH